MPVNLIKRNGIWHINDTLGPPGRRIHVRQSTKTSDKTKAQRFATEIETKIWGGHFDGPAAILTFGEAARLYRGAGKDNAFLEPVENYLKDMLVKDIKASTLRQMAIDLFPGNSGASMNRRALTPAQAVINHCAEAELCPPLLIKRRFKVYTKVKEPATLEWIRAFQTKASDVLGAYTLFMFLTGCRPSEALAVIPGRDLNLPERTVIINNGKVGHERKAHLPAMLVATLANMGTVPGRGLFFWRYLSNVRPHWNEAIKQAGIKRLTPHCCRHGAVTQLLRRGLDPVTIGWLVDMSPEMVMKTYGHALKDATLTDRLVDTELTRALSEVVEITAKTGS